MSVSGMDRLLSLLFEGEKELVNIKFVPGTDRGLTGDQMCDAAHDALKAIFAAGVTDNPPMSGREQLTLEDAVARL